MTTLLTPIERFAGDIERIYGIVPTEIVDAPRGFAAETYYVNTEDKSYFLKIMNNPSRQNIFKHGLTVVEALVDAGIDYIPPVIKSVSGELYFEKDGSVVALYTKVNGKQSYNYNREDAFRKLANIYRVSEGLPNKDKFMKQGFSDWFVGIYEKELENFLNADTKVDEALEVRAYINPYMDFLKNCPASAQSLISECREQNPAFYLTHSDFPGNVLIGDNGEQYLIDFDEAIFAPLERDSFLCVSADNEESKLWISVMKETFPDYKVNKVFLRYYLYERFMIDLYCFFQDLLYNSDKEFRKRVVDSTKNYLFGWLYPMIVKNS